MVIQIDFTLRERQEKLRLNDVQAARLLGETDLAQWQRWYDGREKIPDVIDKKVDYWFSRVCQWEKTLREWSRPLAMYEGHIFVLPRFKRIADAQNALDFWCWNNTIKFYVNEFPERFKATAFDVAAYQTYLKRTQRRNDVATRLAWVDELSWQK
ncbi:hypothetical protein [Wielerella bovis]|uniref:hypothetical protein n=1 Tax=Wielerella bovis TaxID=2917790 RepID=UPI002019A091|nr:hypothetical protein [Wielerella bovis]ULJ61078.1 hypothetical protein MIS44_04270 [Wielerella bovis]